MPATAGGPATVSLLERYRLMTRMRAFEAVCAEGVTTGELRGELHLATGQEGIAAGMVGTLLPGDWVVSTHRSHLHAIAKGVPLLPLLAEIYEKGIGLSGGKGGHLHLFDPAHRFSSTGIVGSSLPVALGHAYATRLDGTDDVAVAVTGDGGVNTGQFHETLNMAAIWQLPLVVLVENNDYAISVPAAEAVARPGIAARAAAYGAWGRRVTGTDVEAFALAFAEAVEHARAGQGPALLEASCHRFRGHYEGDPDHYRSAALRERAIEEGDPIAIARARLMTDDRTSASELDEIADAATVEMARLLAEVRAAPGPNAEAALTDVFARTP
ncbi:MAG: thiamine pyrophosphate-dependent dehydrogenase E1 component subunit alpha [Chloroflexota bacterium]